MFRSQQSIRGATPSDSDSDDAPSCGEEEDTPAYWKAQWEIAEDQLKTAKAGTRARAAWQLYQTGDVPVMKLGNRNTKGMAHPISYRFGNPNWMCTKVRLLSVFVSGKEYTMVVAPVFDLSLLDKKNTLMLPKKVECVIYGPDHPNGIVIQKDSITTQSIANAYNLLGSYPQGVINEYLKQLACSNLNIPNEGGKTMRDGRFSFLERLELPLYQFATFISKGMGVYDPVIAPSLIMHQLLECAGATAPLQRYGSVNSSFVGRMVRVSKAFFHEFTKPYCAGGSSDGKVNIDSSDDSDSDSDDEEIIQDVSKGEGVLPMLEQINVFKSGYTKDVYAHLQVILALHNQGVRANPNNHGEFKKYVETSFPLFKNEVKMHELVVFLKEWANRGCLLIRITGVFTQDYDVFMTELSTLLRGFGFDSSEHATSMETALRIVHIAVASAHHNEILDLMIRCVGAPFNPHDYLMAVFERRATLLRQLAADADYSVQQQELAITHQEQTHHTQDEQRVEAHVEEIEEAELDETHATEQLNHRNVQTLQAAIINPPKTTEAMLLKFSALGELASEQIKITTAAKAKKGDIRKRQRQETEDAKKRQKEEQDEDKEELASRKRKREQAEANREEQSRKRPARERNPTMRYGHNDK